MVMPRVEQRLLLRQISNIHDWILGNAKKEVGPYHTCDLLPIDECDLFDILNSACVADLREHPQSAPEVFKFKAQIGFDTPRRFP